MKDWMKDKKNGEFKDNLTKDLFGVSFSEAMATATCVYCRGKAKVFKDELSEKEYKISGLCQRCQDETFGEK